MSDQNNSRGVHRQRESRPLDNPEIKRENDWWDDMCKRAGEKHYWSKGKKKTPKKDK